MERGEIEDEGEKRPRRGQTNLKYQKRQLKLMATSLATSLSHGTIETQEHSHLSRGKAGSVGS